MIKVANRITKQKDIYLAERQLKFKCWVLNTIVKFNVAKASKF